ncbi:hypothetical protein OIV83_003620 [Microbotryomycetes sp. JL201]|nr:hypothetical protein OIV83_003620 [Microbotryomycetes sp. JL201]
MADPVANVQAQTPSQHPRQQPSQQQPQQPIPLSSVAHQLLLCQIVCQTGTRDWQVVCRLVEQSKYFVGDARTKAGVSAEASRASDPLTLRVCAELAVQVCATRFQQLVKGSGLQYTEPLEPNARVTRKVIRNLYAKSLHQALSLVHTRLKEERRIAAEIDAIKAGKLDSQLIASAPPELRARILEARAKQNEKAAVDTAHKAAVAAEQSADAAGEKEKGKAKAASEDRSEEADGDVKMADATRDKVEVGSQKGDVRAREESTEVDAVGRLDGFVSRDATPTAVRRSSRRGCTVDAESAAGDADTPQADGDGDVGDIDGEDGAESEAGDEHDDEEGGRKPSRRKTSAGRSARRNKRKTSEPATSPPPERSSKRVKTEDEQQAAESARFRKAITLLLSRLDDEPSINMFKQAVKRSDAPAYPDAVKRPMWLQQVVSRVKKGITTNEVELMRDMALLCANAIQFNGKEDSVGKEAAELWSKFETMMEEHLTRFRGDDM